MIRIKGKNNSSTRLKNSILNGLNQALEYSLGNKNNAVWLHKVSISELPNFQSKEIKNIIISKNPIILNELKIIY